MTTIVQGALLLFVFFMFHTYGYVIWPVIGGTIVLGLAYLIYGLIKESWRDDDEKKIRLKEGTEKMGCGAYSRRIVEAANARLLERYHGENALISPVGHKTEGLFDFEVYAVDGFYMDVLHDDTDAAYKIEFTTVNNDSVGMTIEIQDKGRRPGKKINPLKTRLASVEDAADAIVEALIPIYDEGEAAADRS